MEGGPLVSLMRIVAECVALLGECSFRRVCVECLCLVYIL